jgi:hypothetical protein
MTKLMGWIKLASRDGRRETPRGSTLLCERLELRAMELFGRVPPPFFFLSAIGKARRVVERREIFQGRSLQH